jgi:hypothetical protein
MAKWRVCSFFMIGYNLITKRYLIVEELGTQITQKTFRSQDISVVSGQPEAVSRHKLQKVHL